MKDPGRIRAVLLLVMMLALGGCISAFNPVHGDWQPKGTTLAVIAGLDNEANVLTAQYMTEALNKYTRFQVASQRLVRRAIPGYPDNIQGPYKSAYFEIEVDYSKTDLKRIRQIQQQLGVDYLYVLWTPSATEYGGKIHSLNVIAQMFESGKEVANGRFNAIAGNATCCLSPAPKDEDKVNAVRDATEYVAKEIGQTMGMAR